MMRGFGAILMMAAALLFFFYDREIGMFCAAGAIFDLLHTISIQLSPDEESL